MVATRSGVNMSQFLRAVLLSLGVTAFAAGCRIAPVMDVVEAPVEANKAVTAADVEKAIVRAGSGLGWRIRSVKPGLMEGTLNLREHTAVVDIPYTTKTYS